MQAPLQLEPISPQLRVSLIVDRGDRAGERHAVAVVCGDPALEEAGARRHQPVGRLGIAQGGSAGDRRFGGACRRSAVAGLVKRNGLDEQQLGHRLRAAPAQLLAGPAGHTGGGAGLVAAQFDDRELVPDVSDRRQVVACVSSLQHAGVKLGRLLVLPLLESEARKVATLSRYPCWSAPGWQAEGGASPPHPASASSSAERMAPSRAERRVIIGRRRP